MKFLDLPTTVQKQLGKQFLIPSNPTNVLVDNGLVYELFGTAKVALSVNTQSLYGGTFHTESLDRSNKI